MTITQWPNSTFGATEISGTLDAPPSRAEIWLWRTVYLTIVAAVLCILAAIAVKLIGLGKPHDTTIKSSTTIEPARIRDAGTERRIARAGH